MPFLIRETNLQADLHMAEMCFYTLGQSQETTIVIYNQGCLSNDEVMVLASTYGLGATVIGATANMGIPKARQSCFEYIWTHFNDATYISELHVDMKFPRNWYQPLVEYLEATDEPMVSPGIVTQFGEIQPEGIHNPSVLITDVNEFINSLSQLTSDETRIGFVHPVIHKSDVLKEIGGYDNQFLTGKQGFEDDSLLLGYLYYMGTRTNWRPKCYLKSRVYHAAMGQRMTLENFNTEIQRNLDGLMKQYGAYGFKHLSQLHCNNKFFSDIYACHSNVTPRPTPTA